MVAILDYGVGNLFSLCCSLEKIGQKAVVTADPEIIAQAERVILPGVGAFGDAMQKLRQSGLDRVLLEQAAAGKPILGICLGMQMLFEKSYEFGEHHGLGLLSGQVVPMAGAIPTELKIPHIGWNALKYTRESRLLSRVQEGQCVYFVHSFYAENCQDSLIATAEYGMDLTAAVQKGNVCGCQFHPEKSGDVGLQILRSFCEEDMQ